jgi:adenine/guanine phosphoribosyltransferase-like PRPP-binding protein
MDVAEIKAGLERGGAVVRPQVSDGETRFELTKYNGLLDPRGAETLAGALAEQLDQQSATLVVVWEEIEDIVLGYVVARQLGVPVLRTFNADGLVGQSGPLERNARAVLVTDCARDANGSRAVGALLERAGGTLLGVAALVDAGDANLTPLASLCSLRGDLASLTEQVSGARGSGGAR